MAAFPNGRGNIARLAIAQALAGANPTVIFATGAVVGNTLVPDKALATLPVMVFVIGTAAALPAGVAGCWYGCSDAILCWPAARIEILSHMSWCCPA